MVPYIGINTALKLHCQRVLVVQLRWSVSDGGGNGARGMKPPYGGVPGLCGDPFEAYDHQPISNFVGMPHELANTSP